MLGLPTQAAAQVGRPPLGTSAHASRSRVLLNGGPRVLWAGECVPSVLGPIKGVGREAGWPGLAGLWRSQPCLRGGPWAEPGQA